MEGEHKLLLLKHGVYMVTALYENSLGDGEAMKKIWQTLPQPGVIKISININFKTSN